MLNAIVDISYGQVKVKYAEDAVCVVREVIKSPGGSLAGAQCILQVSTTISLQAYSKASLQFLPLTPPTIDALLRAHTHTLSG